MPSIVPSRKTLTKTAGFVGGMYLAHTYIQNRLEDVKQKMEVEVQARENLKRRFRQTHDTTSYTVLALLPTLASQILKEMNVEELTRELQARSSSNASRRAAAPPPPPAAAATGAPPAAIAAASMAAPSPSLASSIELIDPLSQSITSSSSSFSMASPPVTTTSEDLSASIQSFATSDSVVQSGERGSSSRDSVDAVGEGVQAPVPLTDSLLSTTTTTSSTPDLRTKAELWNEVKMLTLTRTLTTLYTTTLLTLLTTLQLTLLARSKYVSSVHAEARAESMREDLEADLGLGVGGVVLVLAGVATKNALGNLGRKLGFSWGTPRTPTLDGGEEENDVFAGPGSAFDAFLSQLEAQGIKSFNGEGDDEGEGEGEGEGGWDIPEDTENKYLTLSWWLLHVGWKDVDQVIAYGPTQTH
ncbi:hypothetical protein MD484_g4712, partial [Candolleomyces efflorescens]